MIVGEGGSGKTTMVQYPVFPLQELLFRRGAILHIGLFQPDAEGV